MKFLKAISRWQRFSFKSTLINTYSTDLHCITFNGVSFFTSDCRTKASSLFVNTKNLLRRLNCYFNMPMDSLSRSMRLPSIQLEARRASWKRAHLGRSWPYFCGDTLVLLNMLLVRSYNCFILSAWPEGDHLPARAGAPRQEEEKGARTEVEGARNANRHAAFVRKSSFALPEVLPGRPRLFNRPPPNQCRATL